MKRYVFKFEGTAIGKDKLPYTEQFFTVATTEEEALAIVTASNPKVIDLIYTGTKHPCNKDWDT